MICIGTQCILAMCELSFLHRASVKARDKKRGSRCSFQVSVRLPLVTSWFAPCGQMAIEISLVIRQRLL